jgi:hypothetical protein
MVIQPDETVMDRWVARALVEWAAGRDGAETTRKKLASELQQCAADLAGPTPSPVESILAETAALSWFALRLHEAHYASASTSKDGLFISQAKLHLTKIDRAHARLMSTLKTLATVRRLAIPAVQINVARQQVNQQVVAGKDAGRIVAASSD